MSLDRDKAGETSASAKTHSSRKDTPSPENAPMSLDR